MEQAKPSPTSGDAVVPEPTLPSPDPSDTEDNSPSHEETKSPVDSVDQNVVPDPDMDCTHSTDGETTPEPLVDSELTGVIETVIRGVFERMMSSPPEQIPEPAKVEKGEPKTIAEVRTCNLEMFKNRFGDSQEKYALEVLFAGPNLSFDVRRELARRSTNESRRKRTIESAVPPENVVFPKASYVQRIRVQSPAVIACLAICVEEEWSVEEPRTFAYPFRVMIHFQDQMRNMVRELATRWTRWGQSDDTYTAMPSVQPGSPISADASVDSTDPSKTLEFGPFGDEESMSDSYHSVLNKVEAYNEMRCYVEYVDREVMPLAQRYKKVSKKDKVTFDDLWLLYTTGETLFSPSLDKSASSQTGTAAGSRPSRMSQQLWRLYGVTPPLDCSEYKSWRKGSKHKRDEEEDGDGEDQAQDDDEDTFYLSCYYIDYDGLSYRPVRKKFSIRRFDGEKAISSLICYPLRYAENIEQLRESLQNRGRHFQSCIQKSHMSHSGWTLAYNPNGSGLRTEEGDVVTEFIDSPTMVDFEEAFNENPNWKPEFFRPMTISDRWAVSEDGLPIQHWSNYSREKLISEAYDNVQEDDGVAAWQRRTSLANDEFVKASKHYRFDERSNGHMHLRDEDLELLPSRVFAYAFRERKHVALEVTRLQEIVSQPDVFKSLKIPRAKKEMIRSLVNSHFEKKELEAKMDGVNVGSMTQDIILAKGKGLVILLHGVPGVGKTATAEAVALEKNKPLFSVTCGDIGSDMETVDENLRRVFRLANRWNCILLIDEADVFLTERSRYDLARNALVSVFLRALEYYDGILFLTTNRVGQLDEAFNSRLHLTLYYPPLTQLQTQEIFKTNIEKLKQIDQKRRQVNQMPELHIDQDSILLFAQKQFSGQPHLGISPGLRSIGFWNGRQIRNAFQIASSLAYHEMSLNPSDVVTLNEQHFEKVEGIIVEFKSYMKKTRGYSEADLAYLNKTRADEDHDYHQMNSQSDNSQTTTTFAYQQQQQQQQHQRQNMDPYRTGNMSQIRNQMSPNQQDFSHSQLPLHTAAANLSTPPSAPLGYGRRPATPNNPLQYSYGTNQYGSPMANVGGSQMVDPQHRSSGMVGPPAEDYD